MNEEKPGWIASIGIWLTQGLNTFLGGWPDESLSSRAYRGSFYKERWVLARSLIDCLFFWQRNELGHLDHCHRAYLSETRRQHLPLMMRIDKQEVSQ